MKVLSLLTSRGFAIGLLAVSAVVLFFTAQWPAVYSPLILIVPLFLFTTLVLCTVKRAKKEGRWSRGFWGSMLFHAGLIIVVPTIFIAPKVRYTAVVDALKGSSVTMESKELVDILETPYYGDSSPFVFLRLDDYETVIRDNIYVVDYKTELTIGYMQAGGYNEQKALIGVNRPVTLNGYKYILKSAGYAPQFILKDAEGTVVLDSFVRLLNNTKDEDSFVVKEADIRIRTRFFPDMYRKDGKIGTRSRKVENPAFGLKIMKDHSLKEIYSGVIEKGATAEFAGMELTFKELKPFVVIQVVKDPTYYLILVGWGLGLIGLMLRYIPGGKAPKVQV